jgi:hypothetical protein
VQAAGELHDSPLNPEPTAPAGPGTCSTRHFVPFQPSASGTGTWELSIWLPAATQAAAAGQDTARSSLASDPVEAETGWMLQAVPFHRSASGVVLPLLSVWAPTAVQASAAGQETAKKPASGRAAGLGAAWMLQPVPFHRSASGRICRAALT